VLLCEPLRQLCLYVESHNGREVVFSGVRPPCSCPCAPAPLLRECRLTSVPLRLLLLCCLTHAQRGVHSWKSTWPT
jgi:hypothetical protein